MYKSKRSNATDIPREVKLTVWGRDNGQCVYCRGMRGEYKEPIVNGVRKMARAIYNPLPNAHFIPRSQGGLGIEKNIVTLCLLCHHDFDNGKDLKLRKKIYEFVKNYLKNYYGKSWDIEKLKYRK